MKRPVEFLVAIVICASACARAQQQSTTTTPADQIHSVVCAIDQKNYAAAQKLLEQLLTSDPKNASYQKALLGVQLRQVKENDQSAGNVALTRKTIDGYNQALKNLQLTTDERRRVDTSLIFLYRQLGEEELKNELLKRASDPQRAAKDRAEAYVILAGKSWDCSFRITSANSAPDKAAAEKAQACANDGLRDANEALVLAPDNESAWSYKTNLLHEAVVLAGLQNDQTKKAGYQNQYNDALKQAQEIGAKAQAQREKESASTGENKTNDSFTTEEAEQAAKDLTELHRENSFDKIASDLLAPSLELTSLVAPVDGSKDQPSPSPGSTAQQKYGWKIFTPNDDLTLDLPENVRPAAGGTYAAASEGVIFSVFPLPRRPDQTGPPAVNPALNMMARAHAQLVSGMWLSGAPGNHYDLKLIRNENAGGEPRKIYAYSLTSCGERRDGVLIVQASAAHYYTIDINGAGESDPRAQRVLSSIKVK
jgi:hypothetical protein